jgi:hypothetical protein
MSDILLQIIILNSNYGPTKTYNEIQNVPQAPLHERF